MKQKIVLTVFEVQCYNIVITLQLAACRAFRHMGLNWESYSGALSNPLILFPLDGRPQGVITYSRLYNAYKLYFLNLI
jgi:hypothetical protein